MDTHANSGTIHRSAYTFKPRNNINSFQKKTLTKSLGGGAWPPWPPPGYATEVYQVSSVPLAKCSFGMIPLSRHSFDCSPMVFPSSTHNVVRASCIEVLMSQESCFWIEACMCLAGRWPWCGCLWSASWKQRSALLLLTFLRMWGGAIPACTYKQGIGVAFKQPVIILHASFIAISTCLVPGMFGTAPWSASRCSCWKVNRHCGC